MYCKVTPKKYSDGKTTYFAALVESYWDSEKKYSTQRVINKLGMVSRDQGELLKKIYTPGINHSELLQKLNASPEFTTGSSLSVGHCYLLSEVWDFWKLSECIDKYAKKTFDTRVADIIKVMTLNRCIFPCSENFLSKWYFDCEDGIKYFVPLNEKQLYYRRLYRYTTELSRIFPNIMKHLFKQLKKHIHNGKMPEKIYYDITSTYFEGEHICILAQFGYSRDKRSDKKQIVIALVTDQYGFPIYVEVMKGNTSDKSSVAGVVKKLRSLFKISKCILIGDRGMISNDNFEEITKQKLDYIMAIDRDHINSSLQNDYAEIKKLKDNKHIIIHQKQNSFLIQYNRARRKQEMNSRKNRLSAVKKRLNYLKINHGKKYKLYDTYEKICYWLGKLDAEYHCKNYYTHSYNEKTKTFSFKIQNKNIKQDAQWDGYFVLQSSNPKALTYDSINIYKGLTVVENVFKRLKSDLDVRPIYHRIAQTITGHVYMVVLAYFLEKYIEWTLKQKLNISTQTPIILKQLKRISAVEKKHNNELADIDITESNDYLEKILSCFNLNSIKLKKYIGK